MIRVGYESSDHCIITLPPYAEYNYMFYATAPIISTISHQTIRLKVGIVIRIYYCSKKLKNREID